MSTAAFLALMEIKPSAHEKVMKLITVQVLLLVLFLSLLRFNCMLAPYQIPHITYVT